MMRVATLAAVLFASSLFALTPPPPADLSLIAWSEKNFVTTGERFKVSVRVSNGATPATNVRATLGFVYAPPRLVSVTPPSGWTCEDTLYTQRLVCTASTLAPNTDATITAMFIAPTSLRDDAMRAGAFVSSSPADPHVDDNYKNLNIPLRRASAESDLGVQVKLEKNPLQPGERANVTIEVKNAGPAEATNLFLEAGFYVPGSQTPPNLAGAGWNCASTICTRERLGPGETSTLTMSMQHGGEGILSAGAMLSAEGLFDPNSGNDWDSETIYYGTADTWERILLPVAAPPVNGANGAHWVTDLRMRIDSETEIEVEPRICAPVPECIHDEIPLGTPFDPVEYQLVFPMHELPAVFVYVRKDDAAKIHLNARVRDMARQAETWGTEIPAVRESELRTGSFTLMPLPHDPKFRQTLRVYDADARPNAQVAIRVFADDESAPRAIIVKNFATHPSWATTALLPARPGYIQLDPQAEAGNALLGAKELWIEVMPLTPGLRTWGFVSVTNNATGHVTTITPQ